MYQTINFSQFCDAFRSMGRNEQFTYDGKKALFEYLDDLAEDQEKGIELDVIALCCDYTEYENLADFQDEYDDRYETIEDIEEETTVIKINEHSFVIQQF